MKRTFATATAVALAVALAGCGEDSPDDPDDGTTATVTATTGGATTTAATETPSPTGTADGTGTGTGETAGDVAGAVAALQAAAGAVPDGQPFDMETESHQGQQVWEILVASGGQQHEVFVALDGSEVVDQHEEAEPDDDVQKVEEAQVDAVQALQTAAEQNGGTLSEMEIDSTEDGTVVWQVELRQDDGSTVETLVDATTGDLVPAPAGD
ncbi:PepSY domain-containing protein [Georgenia sp. TF02-10]|uniref:PepSY domain-containing protein n=1 Tax=Georgenia sp. TF02-10 TaxID=2917725 RepID=UPI001FA76A49|nr:PepSY domain-containing protein [Georgenia sp. TF02-10]UNX54753.1 PepSY domain-containing protein [Georgenia sp. TF02-10]